MMGSEIKELQELLDGTLGFLRAIKEAASDGLDWSDGAAIGEAAIEHLTPAFQGITRIAGETTSNPIESATAIFGFSTDLYRIIAGGE